MAVPSNLRTAPFDATTYSAGAIIRPKGDEWTAERIERMKKLSADGYSAGQVAEMLGGTTRNAVMGKLWRLGLGKGRQPKAKPVVKARSTKAKRALRFNGDQQPVMVALVVPEERPAAPTFLGLTLDQLQDHNCHFPRGDGPYFYCGQRKQEGSSYCEDCHRIVWVKPPARKKPDPARPLRRNNHGVLDAEVT